MSNYYYEHKNHYLFHLPWLYAQKCDECGKTKQYVWKKKGFFVIKTEKIRRESMIPKAIENLVLARVLSVKNRGVK